MMTPPRPLPFAVPGVATALASVLAWIGSVGNLSDYFRYQMPPGQTLYVFSKLAGLTAATLLTTQVVLVLLRETTFFRARFVWSTRLHVAFGLLAVAVLLAHVALFVTAASVRSRSPAIDLLLPTFGHSAYRTGLSLGSIGLLMFAAVVPFGAVIRRSRNTAAFKNVHRGGIAVLGLGIVHALVIGSEKSSIIALAACTFAVLAVIVWRWSRSANKKNRRAP